MKVTKIYKVDFLENEEFCRFDDIPTLDIYKNFGFNPNNEIIFKDKYVIFDNCIFTDLSITEIVAELFEYNLVNTTEYYNDIRDIIHDVSVTYQYQLSLDDLVWFKNLQIKPYNEIYKCGFNVQEVFNLENSLDLFYEKFK